MCIGINHWFSRSVLRGFRIFIELSSSFHSLHIGLLDKLFLKDLSNYKKVKTKLVIALIMVNICRMPTLC